MTVAVSCNLSDGVILGVDSAVTLPSPEGGVLKIYENAEKLFQLGNRPIGVAVFGLGSLGTRSIGSYLREFVVRDPAQVISEESAVSDVVETLRSFLMSKYQETMVPMLEQELGTDYEQIPSERRPALGLIVGGFSPDAYLSEVWEVLIPVNDEPATATLKRGQGDFGSNWFATFQPIQRYLKGFDATLLNDLAEYFVQLLGRSLEADEVEHVSNLISGHEYQIPFTAMPMEEGVQYTRFLVELCINHHRFAVGAPIVGGGIRIGQVTYRGGEFEISNISPL